MDPRRLLPFVAALALGSVLFTGWMLLRGPADPAVSGPPEDGRGSPYDASPGPRDRVSPDDRAPLGRVPAARQVLRTWDARRSAAWASGDVAALRELYVSGSRAGRSDAAMLREYVDRSLVVRGLRTQVLALTVVSSGPERLVLRVTDRVLGGVAVGPDGKARLPTDRATTRRIWLRRVAGEWLVDEVRQVGGAAR